MAFSSPRSTSTTTEAMATAAKQGNCKSTRLDASIQNSSVLMGRRRGMTDWKKQNLQLRIESFNTSTGSGSPAAAEDPLFHRIGGGGGPQNAFHPHNKSGGASPPAASLYDVLGVPETATAPEIKRAFRQLARRFHPDTAGAAGNKEASAARFVEIRAAYATLGDPESRTRYDDERQGRFAAGAAPPYYGRAAAAGAAAMGAAPPPPFGYCSPRTPYSTRGRSWETDQCWC